jgi:hypothetical protein
VSKYAGTLDALTMELAKYYDSDDEAKKQMADYEKAMESAGAASTK